MIEEIKRSIHSQYEQYQKQHEEYAKHIKQEVEEKRKELQRKNQLQVRDHVLLPPALFPRNYLLLSP